MPHPRRLSTYTVGRREHNAASLFVYLIFPNDSAISVATIDSPRTDA
jgi:hypothetical protein